MGRKVRQGHILLAANITIGILIAVYILWFTSSGRFWQFRGMENPYINLGEAFLHGQVSLLDQPDPRLLTLKLPYDAYKLLAVDKIPFIFDASLYKGKYYLYWGPVPGLIFAAIQGVSGVRPASSLVVILCSIGLVAVTLLILLQLREQFYRKAPALSVGLFLLAGTLSIPTIYLIGRPIVYESAISAGQFFLFLGLLGWLLYLKASKERWLSLAGLGWGLSIGSRYNLAISVAVFLFFALLQIWLPVYRDFRTWKKSSAKSVALLSPLILCGLALLLYNYARFGNPLETGIKYQLTTLIDPSQYYSFSYVLPNLFQYLYFPFKQVAAFPFIESMALRKKLMPPWARFPDNKMTDIAMFGLAPGVPVFRLLALLLPLLVLAKVVPRKIPVSDDEARTRSLRKWFAIMLALAGVLQFLFLLVYYYNAMRFMSDFYLALLLVVVMITWEFDEYLHTLRVIRSVYWVAVTLLVGWTASLGFFTGFTVLPQIFLYGNPLQYQALALWMDQAHEVFAGLVHYAYVLLTMLKAPFRFLKHTLFPKQQTQ